MAPIIGVGQPAIQFRRVARMMPSSEEGKRAFHLAGQNNIVPMTTSPSTML